MKSPATNPTRSIGVYLALIPAIAILGAWSFGLSAIIRKEYDPAIPQWVVLIAVAAAIIGVLLLIGRMMRTKLGQRSSQILVGCLLIPLFGTVFGGFYFWLADRVVRGREPAMTALLAVGLGITVFGFGIATSMELGHMAGVFGVALVGLIALRFVFPHTPMGMMRFGALHFLSFFLVMAVASIEDDRRQKVRSLSPRPKSPVH
jgi:hypothetical protein